MFSYDKTQLLEWPRCTYADAYQFLEFQTGKACQTGFRLRGRGKEPPFNLGITKHIYAVEYQAESVRRKQH